MRHLSFLIVFLLSFFSNSLFAITEKENSLLNKFSHAQKLEAQGKINPAINIYQSIIQSYPDVPEAYNNLAALYLKQKNIEGAKRVLEQGLNAHEGYSRLYESLTSINIAMAREAYSKALQIDLKPTPLAIASLSLTGSTSVKTNAIVIRKKNIQITKKKEKAKKIKNTLAIKTVLKAWSAAWSAQSIDIYLSFYHKKYRPEKGQSRKGWAKSRKQRLKKPNWIKIAISNVNIRKNTGKQAIVNFRQSYQSNRFRDVSLKQMVLLYTDSGWQILREKSL